MRPLLLSITLALVIGCAEPQATEVVAHWEATASYLDHASLAGNENILLVRRTAVRNVFELFRPDGTIAWRMYGDRPVTRVLTDGATLYYVNEPQPGIGQVFRASLDRAPVGAPPATGEASEFSLRGNWTDLVYSPDSHVLGFESLFLSRDLAPSAVKIWDLTENRLLWQDNFSYHYPIPARTLLLVSPIDRRIRALRANGVEEIGRVNSLDVMPPMRSDGRWTAWFGPHAMGSALFLADEHGVARVFENLLTERPIAWLGDDLLIADQEPLTGRWVLKRFSVPDGLVRSMIPMPDGVSPTGMIGSPAGDFVGLRAGADGSILIRVRDNFIQQFPGVALSRWRFAPDGRRLFIITPDTLKVVALP